MTPATLVQHQLDAYNAHDLPAFLACYHDQAELFRMPEREPSMVGKAAIAERYGTQVFTVPDHHAELLGRLSSGNKVIDHERVLGLRPEPSEVFAIYEVQQGLITKVWFHTVK
ncbi:MAG: nuclear transport factor 2 family protein [Candidatus Delongbacteria bacterium]|nr:nuclear transport factor 2 family protein [Candidatus Delongbacteria bacterium]